MVHSSRNSHWFLKCFPFILIFHLVLFLNQNILGTQLPSKPTTQPTGLTFPRRDVNNIYLDFTLDGNSNAFAILRSTSSTSVNLSGLVDGTNISVGQTIDNATVIFLSQNRNAYNEKYDSGNSLVTNYGMIYDSGDIFTAQTRTHPSYIFQDSGLSANTNYYYTIISFNADDLDRKLVNHPPTNYQYNTISPLTGSSKTCLAKPTNVLVSNITSTVLP